MVNDPLRYYFRESFLFEDVANRFRAQHSLGAFDFFSIVVWKANRSKSTMAKRLMKQAQPGQTLEDRCQQLTTEIYDADDSRSRFAALMAWGFRLPMASAVLSVLYPDELTVYDYRVCAELGDFHNLDNLRGERLWSQYSAFIAAVRTRRPEGLLRDADRFLVGKSQLDQLLSDIGKWSADLTKPGS